MNIFFAQWSNILEQGLAYGIMALGIFITYRILNFPDLTVDGSFPLGAAVSALLITKGMNPYLTLLVAALAGAGAGLITGLIHVKGKVRDLLSGIITMTALYSINLRLGGSNLHIFQYKTIFSNPIGGLLPNWLAPYGALIVIGLIALIVKVLMDLYLQTKAGYLLRAAGDNPTLVTSLAKDKGLVKIQGLMIANGMVALSGAIICQQQQFFEVSMGTGTMVMGLAAVIIGVNVFKKCSFLKSTTMVLIGAILYKASIALTITLGMDPKDFRLITAVLFLSILLLSNTGKKGGEENA
ncbi:MAG: ABC transporter permease [Clostridiales bacterium]|nr:ABC transporter permease [Clostridiales bacterium]